LVHAELAQGQPLMLQADRGVWNMSRSSKLDLRGNIQLLTKNQQLHPNSVSYDFKTREMELAGVESRSPRQLSLDQLTLHERYEVAQCEGLLFAGNYPLAQAEDLELVHIKATRASPAILKSPLFSGASARRKSSSMDDITSVEEASTPVLTTDTPPNATVQTLDSTQHTPNATPRPIDTIQSSNSGYTLKAQGAEMLVSNTKIRISMESVQFKTGEWLIEAQQGRCRSGDPQLLLSGGGNLWQGTQRRPFDQATFNPATGLFSPDQGPDCWILPP
jgi:hypothetical protein